MPEFLFEALTPAGAVETGRLSARDEDELANVLRERGSYLVRSRVAEAVRAEAPRVQRRTDAKLGREELLTFTDYLAGSLQVGIPLLSALDDVQVRMESRRMRRIVAEIVEAMSEHGMALSEALSQHPKAFSKLYIGTVAAGEASGHLDYALRQLSEYLEWQQEINVQVRQALLYPVIVVFIVILLMVTLLSFVYPRILPVVLGYGVELPWMTRMLTGVATFLRTQWAPLLGGVAALTGGFWLVRRSRRGRFALDSLALRVPIFGPLVQRINMARVVTYLALFYRTGVELVLSLNLVEQMIENRRVARAIASVRTALLDGRTMTAAFSSDPLFPPEIVRGVSLGEATGSMDEALSRVRQYYAREVPAAVKRMLTALQPVLVVVLGGLILIVALSIVLPIVMIYENLGGGG